MLEEQLAFYLEKYLGNYVKGLSKEALKVSVWQGNVELTNMQLKPEALNALKLPIKVKAGFLGSVKLKVPWSRLGQEPVVVELDRIFVLAEPATNVEGGDADSVQEAKNSRVREEEEKLLTTKQDSKKKEETSDSSWLGSLIGTVIGNLKLSITNIHIRYEDEESNDGHPFAAGLTLAKLAAVTVDENGNETFVTGGALDRVQKSGELNRLSFYFDSDTKPWPMEKSWEDLLPRDWSKVFMPGIGEEPSAFKGEKPSWIQDHNYVLEPVGGIARYYKLGQKDPRTPEKPAQKALAILDDVTISLSEKQYRDALKLAENITMFSKRVQYAHFRPNANIKDDKKGWWRYAYTAISEEHKKASGSLSWHQILTYSRWRKQYVQNYIEVLQANPKATSVNDNKEIRDLDRQLDTDIIIQWRMLAHTFVEQERKKDEEVRRSKSSWWSFGWGSGGGDSDSQAKEFTDDDWKKVNEVIGYEEGKPSPLVPGEDQPNMLHTLVEVQMKHNGTKLLSAHGDCILELTAEGLGCGIEIFPETKVFNGGLNSYKISTPEGLLGESATGDKSLSGTFKLKPWDKQLDWSLEATAAPCYVTVHMQSINRITQFFSNKEAVSRDVALQTAAALQSTVNEVSKNAQQQLNDALKNKPKFSLDLDIAAPKVTIPTDYYPDGQHQCKMFIDLGYFNIKTLPEDGSIDDSSEENRLYMRFHLGLNDISAFLVDGDFDWRKQYIVSSSTGRLQVDDHNSSTLNKDVVNEKDVEDKNKDISEGKEGGGSDNVQQVDTSPGVQDDGMSTSKAKGDDVSADSNAGELFFLPMLEKTGMAIALEQICVPHPKYPTTRVGVRLQSLGFQFSPARYHRIMQVVEVFSGGSSDGSENSAFRPWDSPDFEGEMSVLSWKGVGNRVAKWESRYGALAGPFLYLLQSDHSRTYKTYHSLIGKKVFNVPKESVGEVENVLAICDAGQLDNKVAESANALLLRFEDENARNNWQGRLAGAIYRASSPVAVTGLLSGKDGKDDSEEASEHSDSSDQMKIAQQETIFLTGVLDELKIVVSNSLDIDHTSPKLLLEPESPVLELRAIGTKVELVVRKHDNLIGAVLQSLEIEDKFHGHVSHSCRYLARSYIKQEREGKKDDSWKNSSPLPHQNGDRKKTGDEKPERVGSKGGIKYLRTGTDNNSRKGRPSKPKLTHYRSSGDERFFDANDDSDREGGSGSFSSHTQDSTSEAAATFYDAEDGEPDESEPPSFKREVGLLPGSASPDASKNNQDVTENEELQSFVKAQVIMCSQESPTYADIDKEVRVSLSTLSFFCNRPTVIALLDLVTAITAKIKPEKEEESPSDHKEEEDNSQMHSNKEAEVVDSPLNPAVNDLQDTEDKAKENEIDYSKEDGTNDDNQSTSANADGVVTTINPQVVEDVDEHGNPQISMKHKDSVVKGLLGKGKDRVVFKLVLDMELAEIVLNKEDGSQLSTLSQDNFHTAVKIYPASWGVKATLGNLRISDDNVKESHKGGSPYQYICDMRDPGGSSFIELEFVSYNEDDLDYEGYEFSVTGKLSEVRIVFLNRFIQEIIAYFMGLVPQSSGYVMKLKDRASDYEKLFSQSQIEGQPSLKLNLSLSKPVIILPRGTHSADFMELDILHINIRSSSEWFGGGKEQLGAVRLETIRLEVEDVSLMVGVKGKTGSEILDQARGINLLLRRPLRDLWHKVPVIEATVKIEEVRAALSDKEYQVISECITQNMAETPDPPPPLFDKKPSEQDKPMADDEAERLEGEGADGADVTREDPPSEKDKAQEEGGASPEKPYTTIKVGVGINLVELGLFVGGTRDASLATIQVSGVWLSFKSNNVEESVVMASLERLSVKDEREGTDPEMQYMIGHADDESRNTLEGDPGHGQINSKQKTEINTAVGSSQERHGWGSGLTMLVVDAKLGPTQQQVSLRIQRPRLLVAFDFLLAVGEFFVPSMHEMLADKAEENPLDMKKGIFLNERVFKQTASEIKISPKKPLVADYEGIQEYIYDGQGKTLRLLNRNDEDLSKYSPEALIFVGDGRRLIFKNLVIQNGDYLDSSIYLGSNSSYSASRDDGVFMEGSSEESDDTGSEVSHEEEDTVAKKNDNKPPVELLLDLQAIGPELTLYDSLNRPSEALVLPERHIRATMNVFARFSMKGDDMELTTNLNGLTVESTSGVNVLEPFDAYVTYSKVTGKQNIHVSMTEINTNFSFSILHLILRLQDDVMSLMRITSEQITVECSEFEKIWADDDSQVKAGGSHLAFWRPRPPPGFAVLGDCFTPLDEPPAKGVLTLNVALARGKRPTGFKCVWSSNVLECSGQITRSGTSFGLNGQSSQFSGKRSGEESESSRHGISDGKDEEEERCSVWLPIPPEGYVALGCVVTKGQEEPSKTAALCVLAALVSPCSMRDCINIQGPHGTAGMDLENMWSFWRVDNSIGTFFLQKYSKESHKPQGYDLRLAISSYGVHTIKETLPSASESQRKLSSTLSTIGEGENEDEPAGLLTAVVSSGRIYENVGRFKLVWWDKGSGSKDGVSIWRPNVPPGCAMLGDLAVKGYEPPSTGLVIRDTEEGGLITKAEQFQEVAHVSKLRHMDGVSFWVPVAPPGYKAIGCIAGRHSHPDKDAIESIRCVRDNLVTGVNFAGSSLWTTEFLKQKNEQLSIWPVENEARTFFVKPGSFSSPSQLIALGLADLRKQSKPDNLTVAVEIKRASASFYDDFGGFMAPLLDFSIMGIQASLHGRMEALSTVANFSLAATTYNSKFDVWEPLVESCDAFVRFDYSSDTEDKVRPTVSKVRINTQSDLNVNISVANANMLLEAYSSWMNLSKVEAGNKKQDFQDNRAMSRTMSRRLSQSSTGKSLDGKSNKSSFVMAHNEIGEQLWLRTIEGNGKSQVLPLPSNGCAAIKLPVCHDMQDSSQKEVLSGRSGKFVAIRIGDAELPEDQGIGGREYMAAIRIVPANPATDNRQLQFQSARTRCVNPENESANGRVRVIWDEVFVFEVQSGEINNAEIVVTDLARGMPVGYCPLVVLEKARDGLNKADDESKKCDPVSLASLDLKSETLYPPKREQVAVDEGGEGEASFPEDKQYGRIGIAMRFFSVYGGDEEDEDSEETENSYNEGMRKPGAIEVSVSKYGPWSPVRLNYALGPAPWHLGKDYLASEMVVYEGMKYLIVRTLVTLMNETEYHLELRLCPDFLLGYEKESSSPPGVNETENVVEEEVFENERNQPGKGWVYPTLPTDPGHWCTRDLSGSSKEFPKLPLPEEWVWTTDWRLDRSEAVDQDGWAYAYDFHTLKDWPPSIENEKASKFVRRRRWIRSRQRKDRNKNLYISLGTLEPKCSVSCPIESLRSGVLDYVVQVRPQMGSVKAGVQHNWSSVVTCKGKPEMGKNKQPLNEFRVRGLQETEELLFCPVETSNSEKDVWLCLDCKATEIGKTSHLDPILDWQLTVTAPLELFNYLPVACNYRVSEKASGKGYSEVQSGVVEPGKSKAIFHADLRNAMYLNWVPMGGWRPKTEEVLISHPGKESATEIVVTNEVRDLTIHMQHDHGNKGMSAKVIQLYVPCWLDSKKCPSLKYKVVGIDPSGRKKFKTERNKKVMEEIDQEEMQEHPTMLSSFDCKTVGVAVALSGDERTDFGPVTSLEALDDPSGHVELRVVDTHGSHFRFLVTTTSHPSDFAQTQVVRLRPYTLFTNRLGFPLELKQAGVDESMTLQPWDWRTTFAFREVQETLKLQIRFEGSKWSYPFSIENEEVLHIVVRHDSGARQSVRVDIRGHEDGSRFLAVFQLGSSHGPYRLENRTGTFKLKYRQLDLDEDAWQTLKPHSTAAFAWENLHSEKTLEFIEDGGHASRSAKIDINKVGDLPVMSVEETGSSNICVRVLEVPEAKVVRFFDQEMETQDEQQHDEGDEIQASVPTQGATVPMQEAQERRQETLSQMEFVLGVSKLGLSVVDHWPRELIFLVMEKVDVAYATGLGENVSRLKVVVGYMQVDNQLPLSTMPVLLAPELQEGEDFVMKAVASMKSDTAEAIQVYPYLGLKLTGSAWRINVHEPIIWAFLEMYNNLHLDRLSSDSQVVQVDPEIRIETMDVSETRLKLSVETCPDQRPQGKLGIWGPAVTTIGNISKMPVHFRTVFRENRRMRKSQVLTQILNRVKRDLIHQPLQLLTGVNVLGMTSSTLGTMSRGAANLSKDDDFMRIRSNQEKSRKVKGVGDGVVQGTESLARGFTYGLKGIVTKPIDGAYDRGAVGCLQGVFKGFIGVFVEPLSGCLDFMALTVSGIGTSCTNCFNIFEHETRFQRFRLPRAIKGDGILTPYDGYAARGQAILQLAQSGAYFGSKDVFKNVAKYAFSDFYQEHFYLPKDEILMLTNRRLLMLQRPASHARDADKELEDPCTIQWEVQWSNLMTIEQPDGQSNEVLLHLRHSTKQFTQVIWCYPPDNSETSQASEIFAATYHQWRAFCPTPEDPSNPKKAKRFRRRAKSRPTWDTSGRIVSSNAYSGRSYADEAETSGSGRALGDPPSGPISDDMEFRHETSLGANIWTQDSRSGSCLGTIGGDLLSFWRPTPGSGYVSVGDVAFTGDNPNNQSVTTYRNDDGKFEKPLGFDLIWRNWKDGLGSPISIWMPKAPDGYVALGCVVCADYQEPDLDSVWCVQSLLTEETTLMDPAIWKAPSEAPWHCYLYALATEARTFIALREEKNDSTPRFRRIIS